MTDYTKWTIDKLKGREAEHHLAMITVTNPITHRALNRKRLAIRTEIDRRDAEFRLMCQPRSRYDELSEGQKKVMNLIINLAASSPEVITGTVLETVRRKLINYI